MTIGMAFPLCGLLMSKLIDILSRPNNDYFHEKSNLFCLYYLIIAIVMLIANVVQKYCFTVSGESLTMRLRT